MHGRLNILILVFLFQISNNNYAQSGCVPLFKYETNDLKHITINDYVANKFQSDFFNYFEKICNQYYDVIKFKINQENEVVDIKYSSTDTNIQKFIKEILVSTNGKWGLSLCDENETSKEIEMPIYFMFTDPCGTVMKMTYYTDTIPQEIMPMTIDGLKIQSISENKISLWPIKCRGPFIQKYNLIKD